MFTKGWLPVLVVGCVLLLAGSMSTTAFAIPMTQPTATEVPYAGRLADAAGQPVPDGAYAFRFTLYAEPDGGDPLWAETVTDVAVTGGTFATTLGTVVPLPAPLPNDGKVWVLVAVRGPGEEAFTELTPRQLLAVEVKGNLVDSAAVDAQTCPHTHWHELWSGSRTDYGFRVENAGTGDGLRALTHATSGSYGAVYAVNSGTGAGVGVYAYSSGGVGLSAESGKTDGVSGRSVTTNKSGVYGYHTANGYGVFGRSTNRFGVGAAGGGDSSGTDLYGDLLLDGVRGEIIANGTYLNVYSNTNFNVDLDNDNNTANACFNVWTGAEALAGRICEDGTKSAIVATESYGTRAVYAMESPEVWLEDVGSATLSDGVVVVTIDPVFGELISTTDYHVFVTPLGDCNGLYVAEKGPTGFTVKELGGGTSDVAFDYRVAAKRIGLEGLRMEVVDAASESVQK